MLRSPVTRRARVVVPALALLALAAGLAVVGSGPPAQAGHGANPCPGPGLQNLSFEEEGGSFHCWDVVQPVPDELVVVGTEDKTQFPVYDVSPPPEGIVVAPLSGDYQARFGSPQTISQSQNRPENRLQQRFDPVEGAGETLTLRVGVWLFSWDHRGSDLFRIALRDAAGAELPGFSVSFSPDPSNPTPLSHFLGSLRVAGTDTPAPNPCILPCELGVDVGKRNDFLNSGWIVAEISGELPAGFGDADLLTLELAIGGTDSDSLTTWGYLDATAAPPHAAFTYAYTTFEGDGIVHPTIPGAPIPVEGSVVHLISQATDPDDDIVSYLWEIFDGPIDETPELVITEPEAFFVPAQGGTYSVRFTVTDSTGLSDSATEASLEFEFDPTTPADNVTAEFLALEVANAPTIVNALDTEALAGSAVTLVGRFWDTGWLDTHISDWGTPVSDPMLDEDHSPALGSGRVTASVTPGASFSSVLTVNETGGAVLPCSLPGAVGVTCDAFDVTVVPDDPTRHESGAGNDTFSDDLPSLTSDAVHLSYIQSSGDVDIFELVWPGTGAEDQLFPATSEVLVTLRGLQDDLPADLDLILFTKPPDTSGFAGTGFAGTGFAGTGFAGTGFAGTGFAGTGFAGTGFAGTGFAGTGFAGTGFAGTGFAGTGFTQTGFAGTGFAGTGFAGTGFAGTGFAGTGFAGTGFAGTGFAGTGFAGTGFAGTGAEFSPYFVNPFAFTPLSQLAYTGLEDAPVTSTDIELAELALGALPADVQVVGYSGNLGLAPEVLLAGIDVPGTRLYVAVVGHGGAASSTPYALQVESSMPMLAAALNADPGSAFGQEFVSAGACGPRFDPPIAHVDDGGDPLYDVLYDPYGADADTLFVTQDDRLRAIFNLSANDWSNGVDGFLDEMKALADHPAIRGRIISVSGDIGGGVNVYDELDGNTCSVDAANAVTDHIRGVVADLLATYDDGGTPEVEDDDTLTPNNFEYLVILGNDDIIPFRRVPDQTIISNERLYLLNAFLEPGTPMFSALWGSYMLTDDFYADMIATAWQGRALYVPDFPVGRVVDTPAEMVGQAQAFLLSDGVLDPGTAEQGVIDPATALAAGYDFFKDGTAATATALLNGGLDTSTLNNDDWNADDLRCVFLGDASGNLTIDPIHCGIRDVSAVNAHFTHWAAVAAAGFEVGDFTDLLYAFDVQDANDPALPGLYDALYRRIVFSIGCHAGYNVPDGAIAQGLDTEQLGFDPALDFPQAMAIQRAVMIGSTGFGLGDDEGIGGTEQLMVDFTERLLSIDDGIAIGLALMLSKHDYLTSLSSMTVYDEKSSVQSTLYGLPQYEVDPPAGTGLETPINTAQAGGGDETLHVTIDGVPQLPIALNRVEVPNGIYYNADGDAQATAGRPIQPRATFDVSPEVGQPAVQSVLLKSATFLEVPDVDAVFARPTTEWEGEFEEPSVCLTIPWPNNIVTANSLNTAAGLVQKVVLVPGQFTCTDTVAVTGVQRLYTDVSLETLPTIDPFDSEKPAVLDVDTQAGDPAGLDVIVRAADGNDVGRILVLVAGATAIGPAQLLGGGEADLTGAALAATQGPPGTFVITIEELAAGEKLLLYVCDPNNNCAFLAGKAAGYGVIDVDAGIDQGYQYDTPVFFRTEVADFTSLTGPLSFLWEFGDGDIAGGPLDPANPDILEFDVDAAGNLSFLVRHVYTSGPDQITASVQVSDAAAASGMDDVLLTLTTDDDAGLPAIARADGDIVYGFATSGETTMTITVFMADDIVFDSMGDENDISYRLQIDNLGVDPDTGEFALDGVFDEQWKFIRGAVQNGPPSLVVQPVGATGLAWTFALADIGRDGANRVLPLRWGFETQVGEPAAGQVGKNDQLLNEGVSFFGYVLGVNSVPVAQPDEYGTDEDTTLEVAAPGVLGNDDDPDGDLLSAILVTDVTHGALALNLDGSFTYEPAPDFHGNDSFTYAPSDGQAGAAVTVTITVEPINDPPTATDDAYTVAMGDTLNVAAPGVLANDADVEGDPFTAVLITNVSHGTLALNADGSFQYEPNAAFSGPDSFTYAPDDGDAGAAATVTISVEEPNLPPVAVDDEAAVAKRTTIVIEVLANDTDPNGADDIDPSTVAVVSPPSNGTATVEPDGTISYRSKGNFSGLVTFTYTVRDQDGAISNEATVTVTVS